MCVCGSYSLQTQRQVKSKLGLTGTNAEAKSMCNKPAEVNCCLAPSSGEFLKIAKTKWFLKNY